MIQPASSGSPPRVVVVGAGAVGCYFGGMLARSGVPVTLLGRPGSTSPHFQALQERGVTIAGVDVQETIALPVQTDPAAVHEADLVLFAVKTLDTETAAQGIATHLRDDTLVISFQNGVDNVERMATAGVHALPAVVFVAAEIETPGTVRHRGRGDLILSPDQEPEQVAAIASWFEAAGVPCPVSDQFASAQWTKLIANSMANAISALSGAPYRAINEYKPAWELAERAAHEAGAVAAASGVLVDVQAAIETMRSIALSVGEATSSTEQDLSRKRLTEIQSLNGIVSRRGAQLSVPTPTHDALTALVGLREYLWERKA